ncbi:Adenylate cyclase [Hyphomicrobiales bacterium]|nr:Adenylate cyclase [Hyphomicrobiales bacterium]CAH1699278.1 Adenylate cyclase [Hyphomicrobiales bacterium]CAI0343065.1 adenylate cyclase [Hyphomicrobiales bacterium]
MRTGLQTIMTTLALGGVLIVAGSVHVAWWRTATRNSTALAAEIERQVTASVRHEWWSQVTGAEAAYRAAARLIERDGSPASRDAALTQPLGSMSLVTALAHEGAQGAVVAIEPGARGGEARLQTATGLWPAVATTEPGWVSATDPTDAGPAVAYIGRLSDGSRLGAFVALSQVTRLLGQIAVGRTGGAVVIDPAGRLVVEPVGREMDRTRLTKVSRRVGDALAQRIERGEPVPERISVDLKGERFAVGLSPLHFQGWQFVVIVPERDFLGEIDAATRRVGIGLAVAIALAGLIAAAVARLVLVRPIRAVAADLGHLERFEFDALVHRRSRLTEIDQLSAALARMAAGLANFGRFIPIDLVRELVAHGGRAEPGGKSAHLTILFADLAGFTHLAERLGPAVLPIASRFLELASEVVEQRAGTVDKFIGDAVMAFWGAPRPTPHAALQACRAALAIVAETAAAGLMDADGRPLKVRVGLHSDEAIVGNIGSRTRLNYTAIGDGVNLASRLEGANKVYGTAILISEETRREAGDAILVREVDRIVVYGRDLGVTVYELLGLSVTMTCPAWVESYERALAAYRQRRFRDALSLIDACLTQKPGDGPAKVLAVRCREAIAAAPSPDWQSTHALQTK